MSTEVCAGSVTLSGATGSLSDGPGDYLPNALCSWRISVPGSAVTLSFSSVSLEANYDFVKVYQGAAASAPLAEVITGSRPSAVVSSESGELFVRFSSDGSVQRAGFAAAYTSASPGSSGSAASAAPVGPTPRPDVDMGACSGTATLMGGSGTLSDGPSDYGPNSNCRWVINAPGAPY